MQGTKQKIKNTKNKILIFIILLLTIGIGGYLYYSLNFFPKNSFIGDENVGNLKRNDLLGKTFNREINIKINNKITNKESSYTLIATTIVKDNIKKELNKKNKEFLLRKPIVLDNLTYTYSESEVKDIVKDIIKQTKNHRTSEENEYLGEMPSVFIDKTGNLQIDSGKDGTKIKDEAEELIYEEINNELIQENYKYKYNIDGKYQYRYEFVLFEEDDGLLTTYKKERNILEEKIYSLNDNLNEEILIKINYKNEGNENLIEEFVLEKEKIISLLDEKIFVEETIFSETINVSINEEKTKEFLKELNNKYKSEINKKNNVIYFNNHNNETIKLSTVWNKKEIIIDEKHIQDFINRLTNILNRDNEKSIQETRQIILETEIKEDIPIDETNYFNGGTYVEVSLNEQHLWYFKDGKVILEAPVTTGKRNHETNLGVHKLTYKTKNATLRGPGYASFVYYWMPFNSSGEGFHDATWRKEFGTMDWLEKGSHGCVNMRTKDAKFLYENIIDNCPVFVY